MTDDLIIPMRLEHIPACLRVIARAWDTQTAQTAQDDLRAMFLSLRWPPTFYVAHTPERGIVGVSGHVTSWKNWGVLDLIYTAVLPEVRRRGVGTGLVERCLEDADDLDCAVMLTTHIPGFYQPHGFEVLDNNLVCAGKINTLMLRRCKSQPRLSA